MTDAGQARRPNILYLLADDLGWADVSYHIRTPAVVSWPGTLRPDRTLFWNFRGNEFGARIGDLKLRTDGALRPERTELFDLAVDPGERRNLFREAPARAADLLNLIRQERELDDSSKRPDAPP